MEEIPVKFDEFRSIRGTRDQDSALFTVLAVLLAIVSVHALFWLFVGLNQPIADLHQFRQTQTAIAAYWIWRGGPWLAYETPVLGYPWSIPYEFPIFQYLLAALRLIGIPLAEGGRLLSFGFYLGLLWPVKVLLRNLGFGRIEYCTLSILLLSSPLYIYWSRTVMIESCALFFGLAWLAFLIQYLQTRVSRDACIAIVLGVVAINAKLTTFATLGIIGGITVLATAYRMFQSGLTERDVRVILTAATIGFVPFATGLAWVTYTDHVKLRNMLGSQITSARLSTWWLYGTTQQRCSSQFWQGTILSRIIPDVLGFSAVPGLIAAGGAMGSARHLPLLGLSMLGFLVPLLLFTNLNIVHNYYPYANGVFLLAGVGFGLGSIAHSGKRALSAVLLAIVVAGQLIYFNASFGPVISADYRGNREVQMGGLAKSLTRPDDSLIIFGEDWSSAIAYEAERRAITMPFWAAPATVAQILNRPEDYLGGARLGAIVYRTPRRVRLSDRVTAVPAQRPPRPPGLPT